MLLEGRNLLIEALRLAGVGMNFQDVALNLLKYSLIVYCRVGAIQSSKEIVPLSKYDCGVAQKMSPFDYTVVQGCSNTPYRLYKKSGISRSGSIKHVSSAEYFLWLVAYHLVALCKRSQFEVDIW
jgi:hypothetical protein